MITRLKIAMLIISIGLGAGIIACLDEVPEELTTPLPEIPVPYDLRVQVSNDSLTLSWQAEPGYDFSGFAVYRMEAGVSGYSRIGTSQTKSYGDGSVSTGSIYQYRVAGLDPFGLEGNRSIPLVVRAALFSVSIENGNTYTNQRQVFLTFTAPEPTAASLDQYVKFSEDPNLDQVEWSNYSSSSAYSLVLSAGDGTKTVYAAFKDQYGYPSDTSSDTIILDTRAEIDSLTYSPPSPIVPGTLLHYRIVTRGYETRGTVVISVPNLGTEIMAYDDGTMGDRQVGDGIYERDYTFPSAYRGTDIRLGAYFIDEAGNQSTPIEFPDPLDMTSPLRPVTLYPVVDSTTTSITLRWSETMPQGFTSYELYRDEEPGVTETFSELIASIGDYTATTYTDQTVLESESYYYAVFSVNDLEESVKSVNERYASTEDVPPGTVALDTLTSVGTDRVTLTWSRNENTDFRDYRVYQSTSPGVDENSTPVGSPITNRFQTYLDVTGLDLLANTYYFRVFVYDQSGQFSRSNEVSSE